MKVGDEVKILKPHSDWAGSYGIIMRISGHNYFLYYVKMTIFPGYTHLVGKEFSFRKLELARTNITIEELHTGYSID